MDFSWTFWRNHNRRRGSTRCETLWVSNLVGAEANKTPFANNSRPKSWVVTPQMEEETFSTASTDTKVRSLKISHTVGGI
jgi:hypothetical protein